MQTYSLVASRNLISAEQKMLKYAQSIKVISTFGMQKEMPKNKTDTLVFRRAVPLDANATTSAAEVTASDYLLQEGTTPSARSITYQDVQCTLQNYGVLMKLSSKAAYLYEDDIPGDMVKLTGEHMAAIEEQVAYGCVRGGTNVVYANGTTRVAVASVINLARLRQCARTLENGRAQKVTSKLSASVNFGSQAVHPGYIVFIHTDLENDVQNLPGFKDIVDYGSAKPVHEREIGAVGPFRFVTSPEFRPFLSAATSATGTTTGTVLSGGAANSGNAPDVYPVVIIAEEAWGQVALKGMGAIDPVYLAPNVKTHANPMGTFGYVGASFWKTAVRLNENWMIRLEVACSAL